MISIPKKAVGAIVLITLLAAGAFGYRKYLENRSNTNYPPTYWGCRTASIAVINYADEHDNMFPPSKSWMEVTQPYSGWSKPDFAERVSILSDSRGPLRYVMNSALDGVNCSTLPHPDQIVLFFPLRRTNSVESAPISSLQANDSDWLWLGFADGHQEIRQGSDIPHLIATTQQLVSEAKKQT